MAWWITESFNTTNPIGSTFHIETTQPRTNMKYKPLDEGWLGETNNVSRQVRGKFETIAAARIALRKLVSDHKIVVINDSIDEFRGWEPHDYRGKKTTRPSQLWNADGSADFIVQAWRQEIKPQGKPGDDEYIEGSSDRYFTSKNVTREKLADIAEFHGYIEWHYFSWEHDEKKTLVHQSADGTMAIIVKGKHVQFERARIWNAVQERGIPA